MTRGLVVLLALSAACGGRAREPEPGAARDGDACVTGKQKYHDERQALLDKLAASGCKVDADCGVFWENNACVSTCGVVVPSVGMAAASTELQNSAAELCSSCAPIPVPPCVPPQPVSCKQGQCSGGA
jgi:hypothetical protein